MAITANGQLYKIRGAVYDSSCNYPLEAVSVLSTSGKGTSTNAEGKYEIEVSEKDSIWFSYLGKPTIKFPVATIQNTQQFDISLHINIPTLKEVKIRPRNYRQDSIQNREDYAKIFNYQKPKLKVAPAQYGAGVGFDLQEIINMFRFKRNRSMAGFQKRLLQQEEDKFIDYRFSKGLVRRLTLLTGNELDSFMRHYRPSYTFTKFASDYDFQLYIKKAFVRFQNGLPPLPFLKEEEEE
ncbi:MAG: carboxypeptidase-like regulatory domain-containing protein [Bacteroidetes bacterium]|nr:carboxypeptidase-like regulatory domain-containing protein [Bacteroidota bacterium]